MKPAATQKVKIKDLIAIRDEDAGKASGDGTEAGSARKGGLDALNQGKTVTQVNATPKAKSLTRNSKHGSQAQLVGARPGPEASPYGTGVNRLASGQSQ